MSLRSSNWKNLEYQLNEKEMYMAKVQSVNKLGVFVCLTILLATAAAPVTAQQDNLGWWGSYYLPGNFTAGIILGASFNQGINFDIYPNFERKMFKWRPANLFAVDFGLGLRGLVNLYTGNDLYPGHLGLGAGPYGSFHFGFRGFGKLGIPGFEHLERIDVFSTFGANYQLYLGNNPPNSGIYFSNFSGINYYISDSLALTLSSNYQQRFDAYSSYYRRSFSGSIGILLRFGPKEQLVAPPSPTWQYFQSVYMMSIAYSGGFYDDTTFNIGDEATISYIYTDGHDGRTMETTVVRALLHRSADGKRSWWRLTMDNPELRKNGHIYPLDFEVLVSDVHDIIQIRYMDVNTRKLQVFNPDDPSAWRRDIDFNQWGDQKIAEYFQRSETIQVAAGTFQADVYLAEDVDGQKITLWLSNEVPGRLVKVEALAIATQLSIQGELQQIRRGVSSPWPPAW